MKIDPYVPDFTKGIKLGFEYIRIERNLKKYKNAQLTSGLNMCISPSVAPGKVIPRIKNIVMTTYGNPAVK